MKINQPRLPQFWDNVVEEQEPRIKGQTRCWTWIGVYVYIPQLYARLSTVGAGIISAAIECRKVPGKVTHRCTNSLCVNPAHLTYSCEGVTASQYSQFTGKLLKPKLTKDDKFIREVLHRRKVCHIPGKARVTQRIKNQVIAKHLGVSIDIIDKILLKAPLYDILDEIKELELAMKEVQTKPHKTEGNLSVLDTIHFNRNVALPERKNATDKV